MTASEIESGWLYLGDTGCAVSSKALEALGVTHIVTVLDDFFAPFSDRIKYHHVKALDSPAADILSQLPAACRFIDEARSHGGVILVHCGAGVSRSATVTIAYIMHMHRDCDEGTHCKAAASPLASSTSSATSTETGNTNLQKCPKTVDEAIKYVKEQRPIISPNRGLLRQLAQWETQLQGH
ncbi:dual specificity protein phosphatase 1B [Pelomyxa schiedti]|nr:dual specificity protein phosphatase 1B [Pelomyxa schiedti]